MGKITINELEIDVIRAWKDEEYRNSLSEEQRSQLPENPAGVIELTVLEMEAVAGGVGDCGTHHVCPTKNNCVTQNCQSYDCPTSAFSVCLY